MRVIVTRPAAQAVSWVEALGAHGVEAVALPLMRICAPLDGEPVAHAWQQLGANQLVFFVSANAVAHFFAMRPADASWPACVLAGSTGQGTTGALRAGGVTAAQIVEPLADTLREHGATVNFVAAYRRAEPDWDAQALALLTRALAAPTDHLWLFSSSESIEHLARHLAQSNPPVPLPAGARALATHPRIASAARLAGFAHVQLVRPGVADMVASLQSAPS